MLKLYAIYLISTDSRGCILTCTGKNRKTIKEKTDIPGAVVTNTNTLVFNLQNYFFFF